MKCFHDVTRTHMLYLQIWKDFKKKDKIPKKRVLLNGQSSSCKVLLDLYKRLVGWLVVKLQTLYRRHVLFSFAHDVTKISSELDSDLPKISELGFKCFNPELTKPAQEVTFSEKLKTVPHP